MCYLSDFWRAFPRAQSLPVVLRFIRETPAEKLTPRERRLVLALLFGEELPSVAPQHPKDYTHTGGDRWPGMT